jgi:hypothetical protein
MEQRSDDLRVRCRLNILRLYPAHRQATLTDRADFDAWRAENVAHMQVLAGSDADIDEGWPDPHTWEKREPTAADKMLDELEAVKAAIDSHPRHEEPPAAIADLIDPSLTPKQNLEALMAKFAAAKNMEEYSRSNGDMTAAMQHLKDAERFESGIKWNRAVLAEVL